MEGGEESHPQDAYELGRVAAARLKAQNKGLSTALPNAIQSLFSDQEFQAAIVDSGVVADPEQRQTLTPIASYHVSTSTSGSVYDSSMVTVLPLPPHRGIGIGIAKGSSNKEIEGVRPPSPARYNTRRRNLTVTVASPDEIVRVGEDDGENVLTEVEEMEVSYNDEVVGGQRQGLEEVGEPSQRQDLLAESSCLCCTEPMMNDFDTAVQQQIHRDLFLLAIGFEKLCSRLDTSYPFCSSCSVKIEKMIGICEQVKQLEEEFDAIRRDLLNGIVSRHISLTEAAGGHRSNIMMHDEAQVKIIKKLELNFSKVIPGTKLLAKAKRLSQRGGASTLGENADVNAAESDDDDTVGDEYFECRFCEKGYRTSRGRSRHENDKHKTAKVPNKDNTTSRSPNDSDNTAKDDSPDRKKSLIYKCQYCEKSFSRNANLKAHINRHLEFKPWECLLCSQRYFDRKQMWAHFKSRHPGKNVVKFTKQHSSSTVSKSQNAKT